MQDLNFNLFNILIISGVVHGLIFSVIVLTQKKYITSNTGYLAATVLFLSLSNLQYWFLDTGLNIYYPLLKFTYIPWHWLVLPMFYIYVLKFLFQERTKFKYRVYLTVPFFIVLSIDIFYLISNISKTGTVKVVSHFEKGVYSYLEFASILFNFIIMYLAYKTIRRFELKSHTDFNQIKPQTKWLKKLIITGIVICIFWLVGICLIVFFDLNKSYVFYPMWLGMSFLVYWIGYTGLNKSLKLDELLLLRNERLNKSKKIKNSFNDNAFISLKKSILNEKLFLSPNLSLKDVSQKLALSEGYVSQLINKHSEYNFNDYINKLRVEEAMSLLSNPNYDNYTIVSVGLECGFNSKSSFYTAFKKFTGKTPASYKKEVRNL